MQGRLTAVLMIAGLAAHAPAAGAQEVERYGLWVGGGLGAGLGSVQLGTLIDARKVGITGTIGVGGTISANVVLGVEASGWVQTAADSSREFWVVSAVAGLYPIPSLPLEFKLGFGASQYRETADRDFYESNGFGAQLGVGYDLRLSDALVVSPYVTYFVSTQPAKRNRLPLFSDIDLGVVAVGMSVRWHRIRRW